jgi:HD-GYP domain-containing protein (c-di-GMP phosphodiesterase class II)
MEEFTKLGVGTLIFQDCIHDEDIKLLITSILRADDSETPFEEIFEALEAADNITIKKFDEAKKDISDFEKKRLIKKSYSNAVSIMKGIADKMKSRERVNLSRSKRVIGTIVDHIVEKELQSTLMGMTTIKDYDEYTYYHSVNVSILAIALGNKIGLPRKALADLGLAALFHDIGKVEIPLEILNKPAKFSDEEWIIMKQHPWLGAAKIFQLRGVNDASIAIAISAFEHHMNNDLSGYPEVESAFKLDLFSRIIAIADRYDAITSSRVYARTAHPPDDALSIMHGLSGRELDAVLLKLFIQMVGVYPIGCLVMLNTNEMGLVLENNAHPDFINRPRVLLIADSTGEKIACTEIDLMEKEENGNFRRNITKTLDSTQYGINLSEYLL